MLQFFEMRQLKKSLLLLISLLILFVSPSFGSWVDLKPPEPVCETVLAPETVTPEDNLRLGIKHLVSNLDTQNGGIPFFTTTIKDGKVTSEHAGWDFVDISARYLEALWLARSITGDMVGFDRELRLRKSFLSYHGADGLFYRQKSTFYPYNEAHTADQASALSYFINIYRYTSTEEIKKIIESDIAGLLKRAEKTKEGYKFACPVYDSKGTCGAGAKLFHNDPIQFFARLARTVEDYHLLVPDSGSAKNLSAGLLKYIWRESKVFEDKWGFDGQVHSRLNALIGLYNYSQEVGDKSLAEYVEDQAWFLFNHAAAKFGWVPEVIDRGNPKNPKTTTSETCAVVDFLELVMMLTKRDVLFWEMADQIVRNQLVEAQFYREELLPKEVSKDDKYKVLGAFCGYCSVNSWNASTMNCCSASGVRGWALVWQNAVIKEASGVWINFSLNHVTEDVVVTSDIPHRGRVEVEAKKRGIFYLRIPVWVAKDEVKLNGDQYDGRWERSYYMVLKADSPGDRFVVEYLLPDRETYLTVGETKYTVIWKGNTVIKIEAKSGKPELNNGLKPLVFPAYEREHLGLTAFRMVPKKLCWRKEGQI